MQEVEKKELMNEAIQIAKQILAGNLDRNEGCAKLGEINRDLDWPAALSAFGLLSHEQYDHENIGITAENCIPEIKSECEKLIENHS